ncbi:MAG: class I SAM-dependent methyltransferase [Sedimentisphaerales bacterium]|nr:class I SAM-dependent methyltransferase [Sedimentisphaerales bacterium]
MRRTEFFEAAVRAGFYGIERGGLFGKKDNVRKYWEDAFTKAAVRSAIESLLAGNDRLRIVDLGAGSGEGLELLAHIPPSDPVKAKVPFVLDKPQIDIYYGLDVSPAMVQQGQENYQGRDYARFLEGDLAEGFPLQNEPPFHIYFSSYCSLSHLTVAELEHLSAQLFAHAGKGSIVVYDVYGRYSAEWPGYWDKSAEQQLPYTMAYLKRPEEQDRKTADWFDVTFWSSKELLDTIHRASATAGKQVSVLLCKDRSILVGRHMDTCFFKPTEFGIRQQVNILFDHDYRGDTSGLRIDLDYLATASQTDRQATERIRTYHGQWLCVVSILEALAQHDDAKVKQLIESSDETLAEELKMLAWLYRNADRFPVSDFWASVMGPQVACVLRNLEMELPPGLGCGHSLMCVVEVQE